MAPPPREGLDLLRQTAWFHPDPVVARMARLMVRPSGSALREYQDRFGPIEGCLAALQDPGLGPEALAGLPAALGQRPPPQAVLWALADQAREGSPAARALLTGWQDQGLLEPFAPELLEGPFQVTGKRIEASAPRPPEPDPQRDQVLQEIQSFRVAKRSLEDLETLVGRCARRGTEADLQVMRGLLEYSAGDGLSQQAIGRHFELVSGMVAGALGRGERFQDDELPHLVLLSLAHDFPDRCDAAWARDILGPALRGLPFHEAMGDVIHHVPTPALAELLDGCLEDRPSGLSDWHYDAVSTLLKREDYHPTTEQARWVSQFLLPRANPTPQDGHAQTLALGFLKRFRETDREGFASLKLPDLAGQLKPVPEALLSQLSGGLLLDQKELWSETTLLNSLLDTGRDERASLRERLAAEPEITPSLDLLRAVGASPEEKMLLALALEQQLVRKHPSESDRSFELFLQGLRSECLRLAPGDITPEACSRRSQLAMVRLPREWMVSMTPTLQAMAAFNRDGGEVVKGASASLRAQDPSGPPQLNPDQLLMLGAAVAIAERHPEHLPELLGAASPWLDWRAPPNGGQESPSAQAFSSVLTALTHPLLQGSQWTQHCPSVKAGAAMLQHCARLEPFARRNRDSYLSNHEQAWLERQSGWARSLGEGLRARGELSGGLWKVYQSFPELDRNGPTAARVLDLSARQGDSLEQGIRALGKVLDGMAGGQTEEEAVKAWLSQSLGGGEGAAVRLEGARPSVGGVLLPRKRN